MNGESSAGDKLPEPGASPSQPVSIPEAGSSASLPHPIDVRTSSSPGIHGSPRQSLTGVHGSPRQRGLHTGSPGPMGPTKVPWANSPATGSSFPQLARPSGSGTEAIISSARADVMNPTPAPWVSAAAVPPMSSQLQTGRPIAGILDAAPRMPDLHLPTTFGPATKRIASAEDLQHFLKGNTIKGFMGFILSLNQAAIGTKVTDHFEQSQPIAALVGILDALRSWVDEIPPVKQSLRYGNPAYRTWFAKMADNAHDMMLKVLPPELSAAAVELATYFTDSFGNQTRIDYGTGHETTFVALLYCLTALGVIKAEDQKPLVCVVYNRYLQLMRHVQTTYWLEPAGSHGVWGLDDYQFLPFVWGSAQLINHPLIRPKSIHNPELMDAYAKDYMYLGCVQFVTQVKKGALYETSPMLNDISGVPNWAKVNSGMIKMYQVEVLSKFPIMQHFLFGSLMPAELGETSEGTEGEDAAPLPPPPQRQPPLHQQEPA